MIANNAKHFLNNSKYATFLRYLIAGCLTTTIDFLIYMSLSRLGVEIPLAKLSSGAFATVISFFINRSWSFKANNGNAVNQGWKFIITQTLNIGANTFVNSLVLSVINIKIIAFGFATLAGMTIGFLLQRFWVFNRKEKFL